MVRIVGVDLPKTKKLEIALTSIYGIGRTSSRSILSETEIDLNKRVQDLEDSDIRVLREIFETKYTVEDDLRREVKKDITRLFQIESVRGMRHKKGLPVRGQRTRTNSRTQRKNTK
jgi:small subunit ribosomal protein S13